MQLNVPKYLLLFVAFSICSYLWGPFLSCEEYSLAFPVEEYVVTKLSFFWYQISLFCLHFQYVIFFTGIGGHPIDTVWASTLNLGWISRLMTSQGQEGVAKLILTGGSFLGRPGWRGS